MYKVIIADDEPYVIEGLRIMLDWKENGFEIIETASDGLSAYEKIMALRPDIAILDIRIPVLNGLELVRKLREDGYEGGLIILTAYAEVDYAREGLKYGVKYFIEKPIDNNEISTALKEFKEELDKSHQVYVFAELLDKVDNESEYNKWSVMSIKAEKLRAGIELPEGITLYVHDIGIQTYTIGAKTEIEKKTKMFFEEILLKNPDAVACVAYCEKQDDISNYSTKTVDSIIRLVKPEPGEIYDIREYENHDISTSEFSKYVSQLIEYIEFGDEDSVQKCLDEFFCVMSDGREPIVCAQMLYSYIRLYADRMVSRNECLNIGDIDTIVMVGLSDYYKAILKICLSLVRMLADVKENGEESIFEILLKYLNEHFREDILIKDFASKLYTSPGYLGALFTKEMGIGIKEYVHNLRMQEAIELMKESNETISEISYKVGYNNYNHFYMQFERHFGVTPIEYRKKLKQE